MEPLPLRYIYADVGVAHKLTWTSAAFKGFQGAHKTAYLPLPRKKLDLLHVEGEWQAEACDLKHVISRGEHAYLAPGGGSFVIHAAQAGHINHVDLSHSAARYAITPSLLQLFCGELPPQWAPFPSSWMPVYASPNFDHAETSGISASWPRPIVLTDVKRHRILGK